jgi:hypothetical protein
MEFFIAPTPSGPNSDLVVERSPTSGDIVITEFAPERQLALVGGTPRDEEALIDRLANILEQSMRDGGSRSIYATLIGCRRSILATQMATALTENSDETGDLVQKPRRELAQLQQLTEVFSYALCYVDILIKKNVEPLTHQIVTTAFFVANKVLEDQTARTRLPHIWAQETGISAKELVRCEGWLCKAVGWENLVPQSSQIEPYFEALGLPEEAYGYPERGPIEDPHRDHVRPKMNFSRQGNCCVIL